MSWILFSLLAAFGWAIVNVLDKFIVTKLVKNPMMSVLIITILSLIVGAIVLAFHYKPLTPTLLLCVFVTAVFYLLTNVFYFKAAQQEEISRLVPLFYLATVFIGLISALTLGEIFSPLQYLGVLLLVAGAILVSVRGLNLKFGKAFWFMILSTLSISIYTILTKYLLNYEDYWTVFGYSRIGVFVAGIPLLYWHYSDFVRTTRKAIGAITFSESLNLVALFCFTIAMAQGFVTLANALASLQPLFLLAFTVLLSLFYPRILKEEMGKGTVAQKLVAILMMFAGAMLIT